MKSLIPWTRKRNENTTLPENATDEIVIGMWLYGRSKSTQETYRIDCRLLLDFCQKPLQHITLLDLQNWEDQLLTNHKPSSTARKLYAAKSLLSFCHKSGYTAVNVGVPLIVPPVETRLAERIVPEAAIQRILILETDKRNHAMLRLMYNSGVRVSEITSLAWKDVQENQQAGQIRVTGKGSKERYILISAETYQEVLSLRRQDDTDDSPVFRSRSRGGFLNRSQVNRVVKQAAKRAGVTEKMSPHWFRHAHASHAIGRGAPVTLVRDTLGHGNISTTNKYSHARPGESSGTFLPV